MHFSRLLSLRILVFFFFSIAVLGSARAEEPIADYQVQTRVEIPMRDGTHLNGTIYRPVAMNTPLPVIFQLTPYPDITLLPSGSYYAARGYVFAYVHVRGRGDSEGVFDPWVHDGQDGYDAVEWFAKQPWCNGKVGMEGGSYPGGNQFLVALTHPPHLATIVPVAATLPGQEYPGANRIPFSQWVQWLALTEGHTLFNQAFDDDKIWTSAEKRWYLDKAAFKDLDSYSGSKSEIFQTLLKHPDLDDFWRARGGTPEQVASIHIPMLEITGLNDADELGSLAFYREHAGDPGNAGQTYLLIGPWGHLGTRDPKLDKDDIDVHFGPAGMVDMQRLELQWYDYTMKGGAKPTFLKDHVTYYVNGDGTECWKSAGSLAQTASKTLTLYLDAKDGAKTVYHSGVLSLTKGAAQGGEWTSDPNDLSGAEPPAPWDVDPDKLQPGANLHGDGLVFHSGPFTEDTEINGAIDLRLWLSIDAPDTDLSASLTLILPNGKARRLTESEIRARYRYSEEHPEPIHESQPEEYRFPPYYPFFSIRAPKGSQLRLVISSLNNSAYEKNWNSMKPVAEQTSADAHIAHIRLLQTSEHPSTLTLPLADMKTECKASAE